ncbi:MAG TPA: mechanosensitive ion channel domain-containing protein [Terriglobales bacterium]|nr:mechanosensitive ion channel domain-containing protein [Terriglobales bacterium]
MHSLMKPQWLISLGLLLLVMAGLVALFLTRDLNPGQLAQNSQKESGPPPLVDESPLETARAVGKLASEGDQQRVAAQAVQLADNEVDLDFRDASRDAADHPPQAKPQFRPLFQRVGEVETQVQNDQARVDQLKKDLAKAGGILAASLQEQLDVAQAQLELDQDELNDAKEDLVQSGADPGALIQRQFDQHQAAEHNNERAAQSTAAPINYRASHLLAQFEAWRALRDKLRQLEQARDGTGPMIITLGQERAALTKQINAEKAQQRVAMSAAKATPAGGQTSAQNQSTSSGQQASSVPPGPAAQTATLGARIKALHVITDDQQNLTDLDKRIQDEQQLGSTYNSWIALVHMHQRAAVHGMIESLLWIVLIVLGVYLAGLTIDHYLAGKRQERTRWHTLHAVIHFALQAVGVLMILLVIFGPPQELATILGFAGAGITVAMKDFIVAFFGWFVLMGKNGIRVGDWVEINGVAGEVIEINLLRTVLLETGNWTDTGHPTGRKVAFVNTYAIEGHFFNFTTSGQWLWDELHMIIPSEQDPYPLLDAIQKTVAKETAADVHAAEQEWQSTTSHYRVQSVSAAPAVNLQPTANGLEVRVRYITRAQERSAMRARLNQAIVRLLRGKTEEKDNVTAVV